MLLTTSKSLKSITINLELIGKDLLYKFKDLETKTKRLELDRRENDMSFVATKNTMQYKIYLVKKRKKTAEKASDHKVTTKNQSTEAALKAREDALVIREQQLTSPTATVQSILDNVNPLSLALSMTPSAILATDDEPQLGNPNEQPSHLIPNSESQAAQNIEFAQQLLQPTRDLDQREQKFKQWIEQTRYELK